ncbi:hypothetical protein GCM10025789_24220 [Tessaracoccus lubricantis]|uniref:Uncharacterized protein n=1 Tax=Tessaracoccus lubricantis TaxID=545543 RepID=A0ABP9FM45_9ACTN
MIMNDFQPVPVMTSVPKIAIATTMLAAQSPIIAAMRARHDASDPRPRSGRPMLSPG